MSGGGMGGGWGGGGGGGGGGGLAAAMMGRGAGGGQPFNWSGYSGNPSWNPQANNGQGGWGNTGGAGFNNSSGGTGGNSIASNALQQVTNPMQQQAQYAQNQAGYYQDVGASVMGTQAPTIQNASQAQLNQSRSDLSGLANAYQEVASGQGPMGQLAENQYKQAMDQSIASQMAMARSAQGGAVGQAGAMRAAQENAGMQTAGEAAQSGILQAQQQQAGLAGMQAAYGDLGGLNLAQYQTQQQVNQSQAQLAQQQMGQNEAFFGNMAAAGANQQQIANQSTQALGGLGVQAGLGEAGTAVGAMNAQTNMIGMTGSLGGQALGGVLGGAAGGLGVPSDENLKMGIQDEGSAPVGRPQGGSGQYTADVAQRATPSQVAGGIAKGIGAGGAAGGGLGTAIFPGLGTIIGGAAGAIGGGIAGGVNAAQNARQFQGVSGPVPQAGQGSYIASDRRAKTLGRGEGSLADCFLEELHPYSYEYRDPSNEPRPVATGGRYLGVMAQDLERVPDIGRQLVIDTPRGKAISVPAGLSAVMAGLGRLDERMRQLEASRRGRS